MLISTDAGFLNKALTTTLLLEQPEDDKTHGTYPVTFLSKALVSEVSPNWNGWVYFFFISEKNLNRAPRQWLERWNTFPVVHKSKYIPFIPHVAEVGGHRQSSGLEKADDWCVHGDLCLQTDQRPIPFHSIFVPHNTITQQRAAQGTRLTLSTTIHELLVNSFGWGKTRKASRTSLFPEYCEA